MRIPIIIFLLFRFGNSFSQDLVGNWLQVADSTLTVHENQIKLPTFQLEVKNLLKSDYPPPKEVALTPIFALHRKFFFRRTCLSCKAPQEHGHALRTWVFNLN